MFEGRSAVIGFAAVYYVAAWLRIVEDEASAPLALLSVPIFFCSTLCSKSRPLCAGVATSLVVLTFIFLLDAELGTLLVLPALHVVAALAARLWLPFWIMFPTLCFAWITEQTRGGYSFDALLRAILALTLAALAAFLFERIVRNQTEERIRHEQTVQAMREDLHQLVAGDVSEVVVKLEMLALDDPQATALTEDAKRAARTALRHLREIIHTNRDNRRDQQTTPPEGPRALLVEHVVRLQENDFRVLVFSDPPRAMQPETEAVLQQALREFSTNILKYGNRSHPVEFRFWEEDEAFLLQSSNRVREPVDRSLSGFRGLEMLRTRIENLGGSLDYGEDGLTWSITASFPYSTVRRT